MSTNNSRDAIANVIVAAAVWGWRSGLQTRRPGTSGFFALVLYTTILLPLYSLSSGGNRLFLSVDVPYLFVGFPIAFAAFAQLALFVANVFRLPTTLDVAPSFIGYSLVKREYRIRVRDYYTPFATGLVVSILTVALGAYLIADPAAYTLTDAQGLGLGFAAVVLGGLGFIFSLWALVTSPAEYAFLYHFVSFVARAVIDLTIYLTRQEIGLPGALGIGAGVDVIFAIIDVFYWQTGFGLSGTRTAGKSTRSESYRTPSPLSLNNTYKWSIIYSVVLTSLPVVMYAGSAIGIQVGTQSRAARVVWTALIVYGLAALVYGGLFLWGGAPQYSSVEAQNPGKFAQLGASSSSESGGLFEEEDMVSSRYGSEPYDRYSRRDTGLDSGGDFRSRGGDMIDSTGGREEVTRPFLARAPKARVPVGSSRRSHA